MGVAPFVTTVPTFEIHRDVVCIRAQSNEAEICLHMGLHEFRLAALRAQGIIAAHDAAGCVVAFKGG